MSKVLSEALKRDDCPVCVAAVTFLDRRIRVANGSFLRQIEDSISEAGELRWHTPLVPLHYRKTTGEIATLLRRNMAEIHCSMKQPHDTQAGWQVLVQNVDVLRTLAANKGYDWEALRTKFRAEGITPLIPTRVMDLWGHVWNLLIDVSPTLER